MLPITKIQQNLPHINPPIIQLSNRPLKIKFLKEQSPANIRIKFLLFIFHRHVISAPPKFYLENLICHFDLAIFEQILDLSLIIYGFVHFDHSF